MRLSAEAEDYLKNLAIMFAKNEFNMHLLFDKGKEGGIHAELVAARMIKHQGTKGSSYVFTPEFQAWAMENRPDLD